MVLSTVSVQSRIAERVAQELNIGIFESTRQRLRRDPTANIPAYNLFLHGQYLHGKRTEESVRKAIELYRQAAELDDNYALAHAGIALAHVFRGWYGLQRPSIAWTEARAWAEKAIRADSGIPHPHAVLALVAERFDMDFSAAETHYKHAIELARAYPAGFPSAHHWYGGFLSAEGRHKEALEQAKLAQSLDPGSPILTTWVGLRHYFALRHSEADAQFEAALKLDAEFAPALWHRAWTLSELGHHERAVDSAVAARRVSNGNALHTITLAWALARKGDVAEARELLDRLKKQSAGGSYVSRYHLATVHVALGDHPAAFASLRGAQEDRASWRHYLKVDPRLAPLGSDPEFAEIVRLYGLATR